MGNDVCNIVSTIILSSIIKYHMYSLCSILRGRKRIILGNHGKVLIKRKSNFGEKVAGSEYRLLNTVSLLTNTIEGG